MPRKNPLDVLATAKSQIKAENKRLGTNRNEDMDLILVTKIKGELKYGNASKAIADRITDKNNKVDILENMQEGKVYMLVPSANGLTPIWLRNSMIGETKVGEKVKLGLKTMFESQDKQKVADAKKYIESLMYQVEVNRTPDGVHLKIKRNDKITTDQTFKDVKELQDFVVGRYNAKGDYIGELDENGERMQPGRIARTNHFAFNDANNTFSNKFYADNGFITTDVFTEGGNFFNSTSFIMEVYQASAKNKELLDAVLNDPNLGKKTDPAVEDSTVEKKVSNPEVKNEETKKDESPAYNMTPEDLRKVQEGEEIPDVDDETLAFLDSVFDEPTTVPIPEEEDVDDSLFAGKAQEKADKGNEKLNNLFDLGRPENGEEFDPNMDAKPRMTEQKEDATTWNKEKEIKWLKDKIGDIVLDGKVFSTIEDLQKFLPEETYEMLLHSRKQGEVLHGIFTKSAVHIAENAYEGTGFHEAFHVIFNLVLPIEKRLDLLEEAIERYNLPEDATYIQIEELLADEFMAYVQSAEATAPSLGKRIANFFKALYRGIKMFFNKNSKVSIDQLFNDIQLGVYKNKTNFKNTDLTKIDPAMVRFMKTGKQSMDAHTELDPQVEKHAHRYLEYKFLQVLKQAKTNAKKQVENTDKLDKYHGMSDSEIIADITPEVMYGLVLQMLLDDRALNAGKHGVSKLDDLIKVLTDNGNEDVVTIKNVGGRPLPMFKDTTPLLERFNRSLRKFNYNITLEKATELNKDMSEDTSLNENVETETQEERWQRAHIEINPRDTISQKVKRVLGTFTKTKVVDGKVVPAKNMFNAPEVYTEREVFGYLGQRVTDSYSPSQMVEKLKELRSEKPYIDQLLNEFEKDDSFKTDFYVTLASKTFQRFVTIYHDKKGNYQTFYSNRKGIDNIIKETLVANFLLEGSPLFKKHSRGFLKGQTNFEDINLQAVSKEIVELNKIQKFANDARGAQMSEVLPMLSKFLMRNNINISPEQIREIWNPDASDKSRTSWNNVTRLIEDTQKIFAELANGRNPFLELKPSEQLTKADESKSQSSIIENFARKLKPALDNEVILSFRNADNKTVYSIQYANYLSKLITDFKDVKSLQAHIEKIADDPLLSNMPFFNDLMPEQGKQTGLMDHLQIALFDGLARSGKNTSVQYSDLSDIEMEAVSMAAFHNQGSGNFGFYKLPIPSDSGTLPMMKFKKFTNEEVVERMVDVAMAETERILNPKLDMEGSTLGKISNYYKKAKSYQILSFLNDKVDPKTVTRAQMKPIVEAFMHGEFMELQKSAHKAAGIITSYTPGPSGNIKFADKVITDSKKATSNEFYKNYLFNQYYMNTQMSTIFAGDPAFYKNTTDYQKRYKQIISPGSFPNADIVDTEYNSIILADEEVPSTKQIIDDTIALINKSDVSPTKKKELIALWESKRDDVDPETANWNNITDAATFVSLDRMIQILESFGRYTPAHEKAAKRIKDGIETSADAALFQVIKPFMFTKRYVNDVEVPIQVKNSEVLLTKSFAYRKWGKNEKGKEGTYKYPKLIEAYRILNEGIEKDGQTVSVDSIMFESAVKVGGIGNALSENGDVQHSSLVANQDGTYSLDAVPEVITMKHGDWRIQQETPAHYEDESGNFGTQLRNLIIADMNLDGEYEINGVKYKGSDVARLYQDLIAKNLETSFDQVQRMFQDTDGEINYSKLIEHLKQEMENRGLEQEYFDAIEPITDPVTGKVEPTLPLWHPLIAYKVESLINSFFKNRVTKQKINGGNMVNATSFGVSHELKYHVDQNGNYHVQALLPWWSKKYFPKDAQGNINIEALPDELKNIIGYRIPTEDKYSIFNIEVVGFTDSTSGGQIILPAEATFQAGLDFDIDKLFMVIPEFRRNNKGEAEYIQYIDASTDKGKVSELIVDSSQSYENFVEKFIDEKDQDAWRLKKELADDDKIKAIEADKEFAEDNELVQMKKKRQELKKQRRLEQDKNSKRALSQQISEISDEINTFINTSNAVDSIFSFFGLAKNPIKDLQAEVQAVLESSDKEVDYDSLNNTKSRNNRLLEIMTGIMSNKHTAMSIVDPGNFDQLKEIGSKTRIMSIPATASDAKIAIKKKGLKVIDSYRNGDINVLEYRAQLNDLADQLDDADFNINYPSTQLTLFRRNMTGKALIGIFANHNAHHAKAQYTTLRTANDIFFNGKAYSSLNQSFVDGNRISKSLASKLAAVVDNAKDPISAYLNMNTYTADLIAFMSRLGVDEDTTFAFVNQPIIIDLTNKFFNEKGSLVEQQGMLTKIREELRAEILANAELTEKELEGLENLSGADLNLTLAELEKALDKNGTKNYYITQYKTLTAFDNYFKTAAELSRGVQATRVDTKAVGPTNGDNYAMVNRQSKLLEKPDPRILGIEQMLFETADQVINPAFNKYAWIKPISLMNKIFPSIGTINEESGEISYSILGRIKNFFSDLKDQNYTISEKEARQIDTHFMTYLGSALPFFNYKHAEDVLNNVPDRLIKYKKENPNSPFNPLLESLYSKDADDVVDIRRIEFYNTGKESLDNEMARVAWKAMLKSEDKATKDLALDLVKYAYFSTLR